MISIFFSFLQSIILYRFLFIIFLFKFLLSYDSFDYSIKIFAFHKTNKQKKYLSIDLICLKYILLHFRVLYAVVSNMRFMSFCFLFLLRLLCYQQIVITIVFSKTKKNMIRKIYDFL